MHLQFILDEQFTDRTNKADSLSCDGIQVRI